LTRTAVSGSLNSIKTSQGAGSRPIRVLLVADKLGFREVQLHGTGRLIVEWATAFDPARVEVYVYVLRDVGGLAGQMAASGVPITFLRQRRFSPSTLYRLLRLIHQHKIDVLHLNGHGSSAFGRLAGLLSGTPAVVHVHGDAFYSPGGYPAYVRLVDRLLAPWTARAISISEATREFCVHAMGFRPSQVEVVINPTPQLAYTAITGEQLRALRIRYGIAENEPVIGIASRLYRVKGHHVLLAAFRRILDARPDARLLIVGDGPERTNLDAQARSLHVESRVCFTGFQEDVAAHLRLCRVTAIPSVHPEPFGLVAVESLAAGVPVVASRIGGLPEIITDGVAGLLVEPDNPEQLAHGLIRILTDPHLASGLADRCVTESERFSMHRHVQRLEAIFRAVLKEASSGGQPSEPAIEQRAVEQEGATA
jgi:glycosyltransferase involved in cell wall biosynthesis